jgi:RNA polymerase sigma-70 factor, ECF subfamily
MNHAWTQSTYGTQCASPTEQRDESLVAAARAGSPSAFSDLFAIYSKNIYRRTYSITKNQEDAEDAMQDAFLRAFAGLNQFRGQSGFYAWLTRIAINSSLMVLRKRRTRRETPLEVTSSNDETYTVFEFADVRPGPDQTHDQNQRYLMILRSIQRLPPKLRTVAEMRILGECSVHETAGALGISETAIKARLFRARMRLTAAQKGSHGKKNLSPRTAV